MGYEQQQGYFQPNFNQNMADLKSEPRNDEQNEEPNQQYSVLGTSNALKDDEEPRRARAAQQQQQQQQAAGERSNRPALDRVRPDLRDPATRAPITSHDQDPTPMSKMPSQIRERVRIEFKQKNNIPDMGTLSLSQEKNPCITISTNFSVYEKANQWTH